MQHTNAIFAHLRRVLQGAYFLQYMNMHELDQLVGCLRAMRVFKGYEIIRQGDPGDAFYLIATGRISVWLKKNTNRVKVAELRADDFFGEMALISNEPRNATVVAEGLTELFILEKYNFDKILMRNHAIAQKILRAHEERHSRNIQSRQEDLLI